MKKLVPYLFSFIGGCLTLICGTKAAEAQVILERQVIAAAGISGTAGGFTVQTTLGDLIVSAIASGQTLLTQGFQQPEVYTVALPPSEGELVTGIIIYPNPASVETKLEFDLLENSNVKVMLVNNAGQLVYHVQLDAPKGRVNHLIPLGGRYAGGMYYVLLQAGYETHTEKLIVQ